MNTKHLKVAAFTLACSVLLLQTGHAQTMRVGNKSLIQRQALQTDIDTKTCLGACPVYTRTRDIKVICTHQYNPFSQATTLGNSRACGYTQALPSAYMNCDDKDLQLARQAWNIDTGTQENNLVSISEIDRMETLGAQVTHESVRLLTICADTSEGLGL